MPSIKDKLKNKIIEAARPQVKLSQLPQNIVASFEAKRARYEEVKDRIINARLAQLIGRGPGKEAIERMRQEGVALRREMRAMKKVDPELAQLEPPSLNRLLGKLNAGAAQKIKGALGIKSGADRAEEVDGLIQMVGRHLDRQQDQLKNLERNKAALQDAIRERDQLLQNNDGNVSRRTMEREIEDRIDQLAEAEKEIMALQQKIDGKIEVMNGLVQEKQLAEAQAVGSVDLMINVHEKAIEGAQKRIQQAHETKAQLQTEIAELSSRWDQAPEGRKAGIKKQIEACVDAMHSAEKSIATQEKIISTNERCISDLKHERDRKLAVPKPKQSH